MATTINLSDPISTLVSKTNTISADLGDVSTLLTGDSTAVDAINTLRTQINLLDSNVGIIDFLDSSEARGLLSVDNTNATTMALLYDSATGKISLTGNFFVDNSGASGLSLAYDSATGRLSLLGGADVTTVRSYFQDDSAGGILFDSSTGQFSIAPNTVSNDMILAGTIRSDKFYDKTTVQILDSDNSVLVTIYSPGA